MHLKLDQLSLQSLNQKKHFSVPASRWLKTLFLLLCLSVSPLALYSQSTLSQTASSETMEQMPKNLPELLLAYKSLKNHFSNQLQVLQQQLNDSSKALMLSEQAYLDLKQQFTALEQVLKNLEAQSQALNQVSTDYTKQVQILTSQYNDLKVSTDNLISFSKTQQTKLQFLETFTTYIGCGVVGILALQVVQIVLKFIP